MKEKWNQEQLNAITRRNTNILVAAAAGSGKTAVLVERIRRLVMEEDVPVRSLLVVTFTKAAAAEMKAKIRKALQGEVMALAGRDPKRASSLRKQIVDLNTADISTFDSFALNVVKRYFFKTDLEPGFTVCDEAKGILMSEDAMDSLLDSRFREMTPEFKSFLDKYCSDRNPNNIRNLIQDTYKKIMALPHPWQWLEESRELLSADPERFHESEIWRLIEKEIIEGLREACSHEETALSILEEEGVIRAAEGLRTKELACFRDALDYAESNSSNGIEDVEAYLIGMAGILDRTKKAKISVTKDEKGGYDSVKDVYSVQRDRAKNIIKKLRSDFIDANLTSMIEEMNETAESLDVLIDMLKEYHELFRMAKAEEKVIDFSDIEHYCLEILEDPEVSQEYRDKYAYIFIDEYQDTNLLQEAIVELVKGEDNLFMVGDVKQSIYKFRLAEPDIFREKYKDYSGNQSGAEVIDLNRNYRSKRLIIDEVNRIFRGLMDDYDDRAELHAGLDYEGPYLNKPELKVIFSEEAADGDERAKAKVGPGAEDDGGTTEENALENIEDGDEEISPEALERTEIEAKYIASLVKASLGKPFYDSKLKEERALTPRDIVILMRSVKGYASVYGKALKEVGIESHVEDSEGYFDTMEIEVFMNLLTVIDNRRRDVELISVLHSDIFGFSPNELATIRLEKKGVSYFDAVVNYGERGSNSALKEKVREALATIDRWRNLSRVMPLSQFIWQVMNESAYYLIMGGMPGGAKRQANLRALCDRAESFSKDRQASLYGFVRYVEELRRRKVVTPEAKLLTEGDQMVRIMTIHKSKGLEFPMVIVAGLGRRLRYSGRGGAVSFHREIGLGLRYVDVKNRWYRPTLPQILIGRKVRSEEEEEQVRILYVALTRARDFLYMVGTVDKVEAYLNSRDAGSREKSTFLNMIGNALPMEEIYSSQLNEGRPSETRRIRGNILEADIYKGSLSPDEEAAIMEQLSYEYPYEDDRKGKSKYSVSELNTASDGRMEREPEAYIPDFARGERKLSAAEKGTVYHSIMEYLDFGTVTENESYLDDAISEMIGEGILLEEEVAQIDLKNIRRFFDSPIGERAMAAAKSGKLYKEKPFTMKAKNEDREYLVQGIIDCYFREGDHTVLLDYKSNAIRGNAPEREAELLEEYGTQLDAYRDALEAAGEGPVEEVYLYLFSTGKSIRYK